MVSSTASGTHTYSASLGNSASRVPLGRPTDDIGSPDRFKTYLRVTLFTNENEEGKSEGGYLYVVQRVSTRKRRRMAV